MACAVQGCDKHAQSLQGMSRENALAPCTGSYMPVFVLAVACRGIRAEQPAAADALQRPLRSRFQARLSRSVRSFQLRVRETAPKRKEVP